MDFADALAGKPAPIQKIAKQLRALVLDQLPTATESVVGGEPSLSVLYSIDNPNNVICGIQPGKKLCLFYLHNIREEDSEILKLEGLGEGNRHVKFDQPLDADTEAELERLLHLAAGRVVAAEE